MLFVPTHSDFENRKLLTEAVTSTITLAAAVATQSTINPGYRIALLDAIEALERLKTEAAK